MKDDGSWISEDSLKKILRLTDKMAEITEEEKKTLKEKLTAASKELSEPPEDIVHWSGVAFQPRIVIISGFLVAFFFFLGLLIQWTSLPVKNSRSRVNKRDRNKGLAKRNDCMLVERKDHRVSDAGEEIPN